MRIETSTIKIWNEHYKFEMSTKNLKWALRKLKRALLRFETSTIGDWSKWALLNFGTSTIEKRRNEHYWKRNKTSTIKKLKRALLNKMKRALLEFETSTILKRALLKDPPSGYSVTRWKDMPNNGKGFPKMDAVKENSCRSAWGMFT